MAVGDQLLNHSTCDLPWDLLGKSRLGSRMLRGLRREDKGAGHGGGREGLATTLTVCSSPCRQPPRGQGRPGGGRSKACPSETTHSNAVCQPPALSPRGHPGGQMVRSRRWRWPGSLSDLRGVSCPGHLPASLILCGRQKPFL